MTVSKRTLPESITLLYTLCLHRRACVTTWLIPASGMHSMAVLLPLLDKMRVDYDYVVRHMLASLLVEISTL